ncbi:MAG: HyaD/HybD family hydrogenase maturation endopeptidase [Woeseiaceae bacterium]|jgi:hydrogenase maturation protease|nr:HyaD/HybD family hydrogenase maturation endopeptidase [Woeseiaceae bacterium]
MTSYAVLGIGNSLMTDDGIGVHVLNAYAAENRDPDVACLDAGTVGLALMTRLSGLDGIIAVDAMRLGKPAGTLTVLAGPAMDAHLNKHHGSVHELGLSDMMDALRLSDDLPRYRALVGIEPEAVDWGTEPTPPVAARVTDAVDAIAALLAEWRKEKSTESAA